MPSRAGARPLDSIHIARIARTLDTHARNDPTAYVTYVPAAARAMDARRATREAPEDEMCRSVATDRQTASRHGMGEDAPERVREGRARRAARCDEDAVSHSPRRGFSQSRCVDARG